jgi:hypothetical protein
MEHADIRRGYDVSLGRLLTNMLSLELLLRLFLFNKEKENDDHTFNIDSLKEGDIVPKNYLTDPNSTLHPLTEKYNSYCKTNSRELCIDPSLADIRNALVHGRVLALDPSFSNTRLFNFVSQKDGQIKVSFSISMNEEWFKKQIRLFLNAMVNVQKRIKSEFPAIIGEIEWR